MSTHQTAFLPSTTCITTLDEDTGAFKVTLTFNVSNLYHKVVQWKTQLPGNSTKIFLSCIDPDTETNYSLELFTKNEATGFANFSTIGFFPREIGLEIIDCLIAKKPKPYFITEVHQGLPANVDWKTLECPGDIEHYLELKQDGTCVLDLIFNIGDCLKDTFTWANNPNQETRLIAMNYYDALSGKVARFPLRTTFASKLNAFQRNSQIQPSQGYFNPSQLSQLSSSPQSDKVVDESKTFGLIDLKTLQIIIRKWVDYHKDRPERVVKLPPSNLASQLAQPSKIIEFVNSQVFEDFFNPQPVFNAGQSLSMHEEVASTSNQDSVAALPELVHNSSEEQISFLPRVNSIGKQDVDKTKTGNLNDKRPASEDLSEITPEVAIVAKPHKKTVIKSLKDIAEEKKLKELKELTEVASGKKKGGFSG